jgi:hypothetical protein
LEIVKRDGVAVDGGIIMGWHRAFGQNIECKYPPKRSTQIDGFRFDDDVEPLGQKVERLFRGHQLAAEGEAIIGQLGHDQAAPRAVSSPH